MVLTPADWTDEALIGDGDFLAADANVGVEAGVAQHDLVEVRARRVGDNRPIGDPVAAPRPPGVTVPIVAELGDVLGFDEELEAAQ